MKTAILSALVLLAVATLAQAQPAANSDATNRDEILSPVDFDAVPLRDAVTVLAKQAGFNVIFDPVLLNQANPEVNAKWHNVTALQGLQALLENHGWQMTKKPGSIARISAKSPAAGSLWTKANLPTTSAAVLDPISFNDVPLPDAVRALALQAGLNILFDPKLLNTAGPNGRPVPVTPPGITVKFHKLTARQALIAILDNWDWQMTQIPGNPIIRIAARNPGEIQSQGIKVNLSDHAPTNGAAGDPVVPIALHDISLPDAVRALAMNAGLNLQFDPRLIARQDMPKVTVKWENITVRQALQKLLDAYGWQATQIPGSPLIRIAAKDP